MLNDVSDYVDFHRIQPASGFREDEEGFAVQRLRDGGAFRELMLLGVRIQGFAARIERMHPYKTSSGCSPRSAIA